MESETFEFEETPKPVGRWIVGPTTSLHIYRRPGWLRRKAIEFLLGWEWRPYAQHREGRE